MIKHVERTIYRNTPIHCVLKTKLNYSLQNKETLEQIKELIITVEKKYYVTVAQYFVHKNHIHLLIITPLSENLSLAVGYISSMMARRFNNKWKRKGSFWMDRFYSSCKKSAREIIKAIHYIARQEKLVDPFNYKYSMINIPSPVLNRIGAGRKFEKLRSVVLFGIAPYKLSSSPRIASTQISLL